jgi:Ca-activated chloride channel family protein
MERKGVCFMKLINKQLLQSLCVFQFLFIGTAFSQSYPVDNIKGPVCVVRDSLTGRTTTVSPEISRYDVVVTDGLAKFTLTQLFINPFSGINDIVYVFPLPHDGAVYSMAMEYKKKLYIAEIYEKKDAIHKYDSVKATGGNAALLLQERPNVFQQRLANIAKGDTAYVKIEVAVPLKYDNGNWELSIPTMVGERYQSANSTTVPSSGTFWNPPENRDGQSLQMNVLIQTGFPITNLTSPSHSLSISQLTTPTKELVEKKLLKDGDKLPLPYNQLALLHSATTYPNRDFVLRFSRAKSTQKFSLASCFNPQTEKGYFTLSCFPDDSLFSGNRPDLEIVLLIDVSGSQAGWPLEKEKQIAISALNRLKETDRIAVLSFSDNVYWCFGDKEPRYATVANITNAKNFIQQLNVLGGTNLLNGVKDALSATSTSEHSRYYIFLTDGFITNESAIFNEIRNHPSKPVVFTFGAGNSLNRYFLEQSALVGNGFATEVMQNEDAELAINSAWQKIEAPQLKNISVKIDNAIIYNEIFPSGNNLFSGRPLTMLGMYSAVGEQIVTVTGFRNGTPVTFTEKIAFADSSNTNTVIAKIWAKQKIEQLSIIEGTTEVKKDSIIALSIEHQILSKYTAFLAINAMSIEEGQSMKDKFVDVIPIGKCHIAPQSLKVVVTAGYLSLTVPADEEVLSIRIFDLNGRLLAKLSPREFVEQRNIRWDGVLSNGSSLKCGKYILMIVTNKRTASVPFFWNQN